MIVLVFTLPRMTPDFRFLLHGLFSSLVLIYRFKNLSLSNIFKRRKSVISYQDALMALQLSCYFMLGFVFMHQSSIVL